VAGAFTNLSRDHLDYHPTVEAYLAGPLYDEEGILLAVLDPARLMEERQRFDAAGHYHRPDVLQLTVRRRSRGLR